MNLLTEITAVTPKGGKKKAHNKKLHTRGEKGSVISWLLTQLQ